ncbi:unnamed protein product [Nezara viridula]|uniref:Uncharacterized protein n=1 Tax=Nezara viridula TaxID=85310 RepID=A0A9P0MTJ8_NEZVI|nr:unnamed protein product [Nezara viridula]
MVSGGAYKPPSQENVFLDQVTQFTDIEILTGVDSDTVAQAKAGNDPSYVLDGSMAEATQGPLGVHQKISNTMKRRPMSHQDTIHLELQARLRHQAILTKHEQELHAVRMETAQEELKRAQLETEFFKKKNGNGN